MAIEIKLIVIVVVVVGPCCNKWPYSMSSRPESNGLYYRRGFRVFFVRRSWHDMINIPSFMFVNGIIIYYISGAYTKFFFNATSQMEVTSGVIPLQSGFDFSFRTCHGGVLLDQKGTSDGFIQLEVVPTTVNYSLTPVLFIASHLKMTWKVNNIQDSVTLGKDLDQNIIHKVQFTAGSGEMNSTLNLTGLTSSSVDIPNSILGFTNSGPLFAGYPVSVGGIGFVGCIISGRNIQLSRGPSSLNIKENCTLDTQLGCPARGQCDFRII